MITYVTAFLCGQNPKRSYETYKQYFESLASTQCKFVLFLDRQLDWSFPDNVTVYPVSLNYTWVFQHVSPESTLPSVRNKVDSLEYMLIQNTKLEWLSRAVESNPYQTDWFAWIDFGIVHVFSKPYWTLQKLQTLRPPEKPCLRTAGIWSHPTQNVWNAVCWRFAGGFLMGHRDKLTELYERFQALVLREQPKFAWEVNLWALLETEGIDFGWFASDHNDSILPNTC